MKKIILSLIFLTSVSHAWIFNKNSNSGLTGYSVPINNDALKKMNFAPRNYKQRLKSPNVMTDLFSSPQTNFSDSTSNTLKKNTVEGIDYKCGVSIIYD